MEAKSALKVGGLVVLAFVLFGVAYAALSHYNPNTYLVTVRFSNTRGLARQSVVRMQGVRIGEVKEVTLKNLQPVVKLAVEKSIDIPSDSEFRIISGILITNPQVEVEPKSGAPLPKDNTAVGKEGKTTGALAALDPKLEDLVGQSTKLMKNLDAKFTVASGKINTLLDETTRLVRNTGQTVTDARQTLLDPELKNTLKETLLNFKETSAIARDTGQKLQGDLRALVQNSQGDLKELTSKLFSILARIDTTLDEANTVVKKLTEQVSDPRLQQSLQETTELAKTTLARFNQIASDLHQVTGDPQLQSDLKQTVANLKNATDKGDQAIKKVNDILGDVTGIGRAGRGLRLPQVQFVGNISESLDPSRLRVDVEGRIFTGQSSLINLGLYDLGQNTRLTLQAGNRPNDNLLFRYGLYASRLGAGLEWEPTPGTGIRADIYDTNRLQLDLRALFRVSSTASVWVGAEGLGRRTVPVLGVQIRK